MTLDESAIGAGLRRAALALYALSPVDREWICGRLDGSQRLALQPLLAELAELRIPPDPQLVRQALSSRGAGDVPEASGLGAAAASDIDSGSLLRVLQSEPAELLPYVLAVLTGPQLEAVRASGLQSRPVAEPLPDALRESLMRSLQERARGIPETAFGPAAGIA